MRSIGLAAVLITAAVSILLVVSTGHTKKGLMKAVVANLSDDDIIAISAYVASLPPH